MKVDLDSLHQVVQICATHRRLAACILKHPHVYKKIHEKYIFALIKYILLIVIMCRVIISTQSYSL